MVRLRQWLHDLGEGLLTVPLLFVVAAVGLAQAMVQIDGALADGQVPRALETTVEAGRAILTAIAGGLITSVTLLLSLVLVAVQLAASQYSPRTLQDWTGDRTQQVTIGLVLGTSVYCLIVLTQTRTLGEGDVLIPHVSVLLAMALGVLSLIGVVVSVDRLTRSLRIGSLSRSIADRTVHLVEDRGQRLALENPRLAPADPGPTAAEGELPLDALVVTAETGGWVQRIDEDELFRAIPPDSIAVMGTAVGSHVMPRSPLVRIWPPPPDDDCIGAIRSSLAIGQERTLQEDIGYGILQLVDVAVRALSPGVNDPNTANDVIVNLGVVLLALWEHPEESAVRTGEGRTLVSRRLGHADYLEAGFGPLRRHGSGDADVVRTMLTTLITIRAEAERRGLPGPVEPLETTIARIVEAFDATGPDPDDADLIHALADSPVGPAEGDGSRPR